MNRQMTGTGSKTERLSMLRRFGYGVPSLERALRSRSSTVALIAEMEIQPFIREKGQSTRINEAHFSPSLGRVKRLSALASEKFASELCFPISSSQTRALMRQSRQLATVQRD
jgi:hypothetical protein